jgi:hypothetical protein
MTECFSIPEDSCRFCGSNNVNCKHEDSMSCRACGRPKNDHK